MLKKELLNAVTTAKSIHDGDYSSLRNKSFVICVNIKKKRRGKHVKKPNRKLTLAELAERIDNLGNNLRNEMNAGFKQVNNRIDNLEKDVKNINVRIDGIDARLDYNGLKDLPEESR